MKEVIKKYAGKGLLILGSVISILITFGLNGKSADAYVIIGGCYDGKPCAQGGYGSASTCYFGDHGHGDQCFCGSDSGNWVCSAIGPGC